MRKRRERYLIEVVMNVSNRYIRKEMNSTNRDCWVAFKIKRKREEIK